MSPVLVPRQVEHLKKCSLAQANDILTVCRLNSWQVITPDDENYPRRLYEIDNPPAALYVAGNLPDIDNSVAIGIVGTRKASDYAIKAADVMSRELQSLAQLLYPAALSELIPPHITPPFSAPAKRLPY